MPRELDATHSRIAKLSLHRIQRKSRTVLWSALLMVWLVVPAEFLSAQPPGFGRGPGGPGGPNRETIKLVKKFDANSDGYLDQQERQAARKWLSENRNSSRSRGPRGPRGGRSRFPAGKEGPAVGPDQVKVFPDADLYDPSVLRTIFLEFDNDDWEQELADFKPTDVDVPAQMTVDGKRYRNVGVRFRGTSSFFMIPAGSKRSFNISLDLVEKKQRLDGYKTLNLLNCNGDPSMLSSYLYSQVARKRIAAPKVNFVKVVVNGKSWGVYCNAQQFNKDFLKENFGTTKGTRWKVPGSPRGDGGLKYLGDSVEPYRERYAIKSKDDPKAWDALIRLCKVLKETPEDQLVTALEPLLDLDEVLWFLAIDNALINSDGYWTRASDYSIYLDPDGKFHLIPHDMNESFRAMHGRGGFRGPGGPGGGRGGPGGRPPFNPFSRPPRFEDSPEKGTAGDRGDNRRRGNSSNEPSDRSPNPLARPKNGTGPEAERSKARERTGNPGPRDAAGYELDPLIGLDQDRFPLRSRLLRIPELRKKYLSYMHEIASDFLDWRKTGPRIHAAAGLIADEVNSDTRKLMTWVDFENAVSDKSPPASGSLKEFFLKRSEYLRNHPEIQKANKATKR